MLNMKEYPEGRADKGTYGKLGIKQKSKRKFIYPIFANSACKGRYSRQLSMKYNSRIHSNHPVSTGMKE